MFTIEIKDDEVERSVAELQRVLEDLTPVMNEIGDHLVKATQDRMLEGKSPDGSSFAPRSATTLKAYDRRKQKPGAQPLWLTGTMRQQIHHAYGRDFVEVGSGAVQAAVMQFGAGQGQFGAWMGKDKLGRDHFHHLPWGDIPARPFLGLSEVDRGNVLDILREALAGSMAP